MASGCTSVGSTTSSVLFQKLTPDTLVQYTGQPFPQFGICTGDLLSEVEASILQQIVNFSTGQGITFADIDLTTCACFTEKVGCCGATSCQTLDCILQAYLDCMCELYTDVQTLTTQVAAINGPYNTLCLSTVTSASSFPAIFQEVISELCTAESNIATLTTKLNTLSSGLNTTIGNFLATALNSCNTSAFKTSGTGSSFTATFSGASPIGGIIMYDGPIGGIFDSTGLGVSPGPACGWALCNGNNGTVDMRGYFPVGVNDGTMGSGSQNSEVNNSTYPGQNYPLYAHGGAIGVTLTSAGVPTMTASVTDTHTHAITGYHMGKSTTGTTNVVAVLDISTYPDNDAYGLTPATSTYPSLIGPPMGGLTSITIPGGNQPHENRPPYRALYFIKRLS